MSADIPLMELTTRTIQRVPLNVRAGVMQRILNGRLRTFLRVSEHEVYDATDSPYARQFDTIGKVGVFAAEI